MPTINGHPAVYLLLFSQDGEPIIVLRREFYQVGNTTTQVINSLVAVYYHVFRPNKLTAAIKRLTFTYYVGPPNRERIRLYPPFSTAILPELNKAGEDLHCSFVGFEKLCVLLRQFVIQRAFDMIHSRY